ncbi:MAG TPA: hypothetical protein VJ957_12100, partial [Longimicrobiales bacterium]|nr:hypothetical protein [Longimicrobiales bacterium]
TAALVIQTLYGSPLPDGLHADSSYVVYDGQVWAAPVTEEFPTQAFSVLEVIARNGPRWGPDVTVDVIVRFRYGTQSFLLRAPDQTIHRVD